MSNFFFFQAEDGIRDFCLSRGLGDVYKRQGSRIGHSQPYWKGETEPHTPGTKFRKYMTYFYVPTKIRAPWETYGTSIKCVSLVCRFIFPSISGCPFTRRHHSAMKPHVTHQTH